MSSRVRVFYRVAPVVVLVLGIPFAAAERFHVASFNVEGYLDQPAPNRPAKSTSSKAKVQESIRELRPEVLALQEIGTLSALGELRESLKADGLDYPFWEYVTGSDTNIHLAILSKFPFTARRPHTNDSFLISGRRFRVCRGFGEVDIQVNSNYYFTLITAHLKSKRTLAEAEEADVRLEEARLLREKINLHLKTDPGARIVVLGDLNDTKEAPSTKTVIGQGRLKLIDTCPTEREGKEVAAPPHGNEARRVSWTHYYGKDDTFSRIDFLLLSRAMARRWVTNETIVLATPDWGVASDHRPIMATFDTGGE